MTLLSALNTCHEDLPIIAVTSGDAYNASTWAYANGTTACLAKPLVADELEIVIRNLNHRKLQLAAA